MPLRNSNLYEHVGVGITEDVNLRHIVTNIYIYIMKDFLFMTFSL